MAAGYFRRVDKEREVMTEYFRRLDRALEYFRRVAKDADSSLTRTAAKEREVTR